MASPIYTHSMGNNPQKVVTYLPNRKNTRTTPPQYDLPTTLTESNIIYSSSHATSSSIPSNQPPLEQRNIWNAMRDKAERRGSTEKGAHHHQCTKQRNHTHYSQYSRIVNVKWATQRHHIWVGTRLWATKSGMAATP